MPSYHKILWSEGLFLTQHHFQQFDAYHENDRAFQARVLAPFGWGVSHLMIDAEGVANRQFALTEIDGILPDGTSIRAPSMDDPPPARPFDDHFIPSLKVMGVYLGLARLRPGAPGTRMDTEKTLTPTRFQRSFATVPDEVTGENEREIPYAKKKLVLLFSGEELDGYDVVKIAEIERSPEGVPRLRETFVPPILSVAVSDYLTGQMRTLLEKAAAKSDALDALIPHRTATEREVVSTAEQAHFLRMHTINAHVPMLAHLHQNPQMHPVRAFEILAQFAGHLCSFRPGEEARDIPPYQHDDLGGTFVPLIQKLHRLLEEGIEDPCIRIALKRVDVARFEGPIEDAAILDTHEFYLGISAEVSESQLAGEFPQHAKVISPEKIVQLIEGNLPGAVLQFQQLPPAAIPRRTGVVYFRIYQRGDRWDFIKRDRGIAIYAPPAKFPEWKCECIAVKR